jgi:hypothetical protein
VKSVSQGTLNCTALNLRPNMENFTVGIQNTTYSAVHGYSDNHMQLSGRYVWSGTLTAGGNGTMSVVWNKACSPSVFQITVILPVINNTQTIITTQPCVNSTVVNCLWSVKYTQTVIRDEPEMMQRLNYTIETPVAAGADVQPESATDSGLVLRVLYFYDKRSQTRYGDATCISMIAAGNAMANQALLG